MFWPTRMFCPINYELSYRELVLRIVSVGYTSFVAETRLNVHQTLNLLIYQLQLLLGEVAYDGKRDTWPGLFKKYKDIYWSFNGITCSESFRRFETENFDPFDFARDKKILIDKLNKVVLYSEETRLPPHYVYGRLTKTEAMLLSFRLITYYVRPFEFMYVAV